MNGASFLTDTATGQEREGVDQYGVLIGSGRLIKIQEDSQRLIQTTGQEDKDYALGYDKCLKKNCGAEFLYSPGDFVVLPDEDGDEFVCQIESFYTVPCWSGIEPSLMRVKLFSMALNQPPIETGHCLI